MDANLEVGAFSVVDVMRTDIFTLTPQTPVVTARQIALEKRIDHLLVLDEGILAGIVCEHDLASYDKNALVGDCMSTPVLCVGPETTLKDASDIMLEQRVSCLPVVVGSSLVGIITRAALVGIGLDPPPAPDAGLGPCIACEGDEDVRPRPGARNMPLCRRCTGWTMRSSRGGDLGD